MNIAIFSDCYLDLTGGIVTAIDAEKAELERRGHTVEIFTTAFPRSIRERQRLATQHIYLVPTCRIIGRGGVPIPRRPRIIERWLLRHHPEIKNYDIFYIHYEAGCSIAGLRLAKALNIPSVQVMHGREDVGEQLNIPPGLRTLVAELLCWFHSWYLPHPIKIRKDNYLAPTIARSKMWELMVNHANAADYVITPSDYFRKMLIHYGMTASSRYLHHGVADDMATQPVNAKSLAPGEKLEIIWHSRLSPEKRLMPLLEALSIIQGTVHPITLSHTKTSTTHEAPYHLTVYGAGPDLLPARSYARLHRLNVTFRGQAKFDRIWEALQKSHLSVLVSYDFDTFGMTLIEAEAAGVPVFIVDPDLEEIVPSGGYLLAKSPSPSSIADALQYVLDHPAKISDMSKAMLAHRDEIKISHKIDQLEKIFQSLGRSASITP